MKSSAVAVIVALNLAVGYADISPVIEVCNRTDPALAKCLFEVVDKLRPNIASGDFGENRTAAPLDPFEIDRIDIDRGKSLKASLTNITIYGITGFVLRKIRHNLAERKFNISARLPSVQVKGQYDLSMTILVLKLTGKGPFNMTFNDTLVNLKIHYYLEPEDGRNYIKFHPIGLKIKFKDAQFYLKNLFNGDPVLEQIGNQAINANPHVFLDEVKPALIEKLSKSLTDISNAVVEGSEEDELLPP
ncbi:circadian clock-controlled protein daywake-like [Toxorhynchites rutilus septentrionalis]|uniref:circadian clock-controlled protein daywake-like n=1 Tax=Toxorhynchites rutilus septentrionalis TaxID=329112 RepID=UPI002478EA45|nr:circadian clock-controlled protein daywake-like [Toxorhynchites rutilus septentrionalis]